MTDDNNTTKLGSSGKSYWITLSVWILRILIGACFITSGLAKAADLWGFVYKIEEYLLVWDFVQPRSLVFMAALALSSVEFVLGVMLFLGNYKHVAVWLLLLMMAFMLPLTAYIYIADPVADCGCFGDFLTLSNGMTFVKNIIITSALIFLAVYNSKVAGAFTTYAQWLCVVFCCLYVLSVGLFAYNITPLADFRSFPVGTSLVDENGNEDDEAPVDFTFIYEKDGEQREFSELELPDSTWTFIARHANSTIEKAPTEFTITLDGEEVTQSVISTEGNELLLVIPQLNRADVSYTYFLNELNEYMIERGDRMIGLVSGGSDDIETWRDMSMASYPLFNGEPQMLKELSRGDMSIVALENGRVKWKRTLGSIPFEWIDNPPRQGLDDLGINASGVWKWLTILFLIMMGGLYILDSTGRLLNWSIKRGKKKNNV